MKSYTELCQLQTYEERLRYLQLYGGVGKDTFGFDRWLNQDFYQSREWRQFRDRIIVRDNGYDLGCKDHPITDWVLKNGIPVRPKISIHHLNPITKEDIIRHSEKLLDPENAICVSAATHKVIHYATPALGGNEMYLVRKFNVTEAAYSTSLRLKMQEAEHMVRCIVPSRERSLALTKLDEALFWANAAIAAEGVMDHEE